MAPTPKLGKTLGAGAAAAKVAVRKQPRSVTVMLTCAAGDYSETISLAKSRVSLVDVGVVVIRTHRALTEALLSEIPGFSGEKANKLASSLRMTLHEREGVTITRPV